MGWSNLPVEERREKNRAYYYGNKERMQETSKSWKQSHSSEVRAYKNLIKYGLTHTTYSEMLKQQNYCCALCEEPLKKKRFIDHNHLTGAVRGILHPNCNTVLGMAHDRVDLLEKAATYLKERG